MGIPSYFKKIIDDFPDIIKTKSFLNINQPLLRLICSVTLTSTSEIGIFSIFKSFRKLWC